MKIVRRYHPDQGRMLEAVLLILRSTPVPATEAAKPAGSCAEDALDGGGREPGMVGDDK